MLYFSTNNQVKDIPLSEVVIKGLADDKGLFMPNYIPVIPDMFYKNIEKQAFRDMAYTVAYMLFGEDVHANMLKMMVNDAIKKNKVNPIFNPVPKYNEKGEENY